MAESLWTSEVELPDFPALQGDLRTDVLVIGGGMAGLLIAYELTKQGADVVLVEKAKICSGTTAGTTAKITAQHGFCYQKIEKEYGKEYGQMYYAANARAVADMKSLCREAGCRLEEKDNFVYTDRQDRLHKELAALQRLGIAAVLEEKPDLPVKTAGAVGFENQGQMQPLELAAFVAGKIKIYENTKVQEMVGTTAVTDKWKIRAKKVVVATHFPFINKHGSYFLKLYQHRSYILALEGAPRLQNMYVSDSKDGFSFSSFGGFLLLGGGAHRTGKQGGSYTQLRQFRRQQYPQARERFRWAAQDTMSLDGIPYMGNYSAKTPDLYVAAGFNKWGMTSAMVSAKIISGQICGEIPDYAPVFSPSRSILKPQLFVNGFEATKNLLTPTKKRCPHLGCALHYNKEEHSWDCACHGSRFSEKGELLDNPANDDLKK